ncbi:MAG: hypothetical protein HY721_32380 [Planctomycetes bacterium]|nr:hypothetical protein [Planctomycetota bacterium]
MSSRTLVHAGRLVSLLAVLPLFFASLALGQQKPAPIVGKTPDNAAAGLPLDWDLSGTDITYKTASDEVWLADPYAGAPVINAFKATNLQALRRQILVDLPAEVATAPILGIAEIPHGAFKDNVLILVDASFGTNNPPAPQVGIFDSAGALLPNESFLPLQGIDPTAELTSIDVNPEREELAAYDSAHHTYYVFDFTFSVIQGPVELRGFATLFNGSWGLGNELRGAGVGIAYGGPDTIIATSAFLNAFETHFALEYSTTDGGQYTGRAVDLSAAGITGNRPDTMFLGIDVARIAGEDVLFTHNLSDESIYAFSFLLQPHGSPVTLQSCGVNAEGQYSVTWARDPNIPTTAIFVFENGVQVAALGPDETTYTSPVPFLGKAFVEVATEKDGLPSGLRPICQLENTARPPHLNLQADATQVTTLGNRALSGVAVTKTPAVPEDFRLYLVGQESNQVLVFDHLLNGVETLDLVPRVDGVPGTNYNYPAIGVCLARLEEGGEDLLGVLDPDGPTNNGIPSATFFSLTGDTRGQLVREVNPIDMTALRPAPFLHDWDFDGKDGFVAGGVVPGTADLVLVRLRILGGRLIATQSAPIPHRALTPFTLEALTGVGVTVLPSGNLLVAGSDTFSKTYTEALLLTPFSDDPPGPPKIVGYAQGLLVWNEFFVGFGPGVGPSVVYGLEAAYFPPVLTDPPPPPDAPGFGVTYIPTGNPILLFNPSGIALITLGQLLMHSTNDVSSPKLAAVQLADKTEDVPAGQKALSGDLAPPFASQVEAIDFYYYVLNPSTTDTLKLMVDVKLDGAQVPEALEKVVVPPGRYFRRGLTHRAEDAISLEVTNEGTAAAKVRVLAGASAIGPGSVAPPVTFRRGDCDANAAVNITDAIFGLEGLFKGGRQPDCPDACDTDDNGAVNLTDMVVLLTYLFRGGPPPAAPGVDACGEDPTADDVLGDCAYPAAACQ